MEASGTDRVILIHDWLTGMRGGEKVLEPLCQRWPNAALYTLIHRPGAVSPAIEALDIHASLLQKLPYVTRYYRYLLPLMPWAVNWRLPSCDLVVSSSHCVAKGVSAPAGVPHVCYCHTPMRYAWHMRDAYFQKRGLKAWAVDKILCRLRDWDRRTAAGVTHFIANSREVRRRIQSCYGRSSEVIHPPVDTEFYTPAAVPREDYYLVLSALAPYKRIDLAVAACARLKRRLVIIGTGQDERKLRRLAGPEVRFLGWQGDAVLRDHLRRARALLFPGEEDFGIVPVEAHACGTPVIALGRGGATETVVPLGQSQGQPATGVWFAEQTAASLEDALLRFEAHAEAFDGAAIRRHAEKFALERFKKEIFGFINGVMGRGVERRAA